MKNLFVNNRIYQLDVADKLVLEGNQSNPKPIFIVLNVDEKVHLAFLDKILAAIGVDRAADIVTIISDNINIAIHQKVSSYENAKVLIFGISAEKLGLNFSFKRYEPVLFGDNEYLFSHNLSDLQADKQKKLALWNSLQEMFPKK